MTQAGVQEQLVTALSPDWVRIKTDKAHHCAQYIPDSKPYADYLDMPWTQKNVELCTKLGLPAASPMLRDYHWPGPFEPFRHQLKISNFMSTFPRGYVISAPGTGKTASAVWACDYLRRQGSINRVLIIAPLSVLEPAWGGELFQLVTDQPYAMLLGSRERRMKLLKQNTFWVGINHDGVETIQNELLVSGFDAIIVDESRAYADPSTDRWKSLAPLVKRAKYAWALTGTPVSQGPMDAFGQVKMFTPDTLEHYNTMTRFRDHIMTKYGPFKWVPRENALRFVKQVMSPAIRFEKDAVLDLPPMVSTFHFVPLSRQQEVYYARLKAEATAAAGAHQITAVHAGAMMLKLIQVATGAVYSDDGTQLEFDVKPRIQALLDLVNDNPNPIIVFAPFRHTVTLLSKHLIPLGFKVITGDTPVHERTRIIAEVQAREIRGILAIPQTISHGITLTAADLTVWFGPPSSTETYLQAIERMNRPGQKNSMRVVHIYGSEIEKRRYKSVQSNTDAQNALLGMYKQFIGAPEEPVDNQ